jgi:lipid II isoglutaminyl synthase (glutamine-hydrolysing)
MMDKEIKINHLYSKSLNIYGDLGNIIALKHRSKVRGIDTEVLNTELGEDIKEADIYFIGGGQDEDQIRVFKDLLQKKDFIEKEVENGKIFLLICGGYQLFGKFFVDGNGRMIEGLDILNVETKALDYAVASRCIGNIVVELDTEFIKEWEVDTTFSKFIVGFENHGGQTRLLSDSVKSIGKVVHGFGNNSFDKIEGCVFKNIIGSYSHGSLLPKNPHLVDAFLRKALHAKYNEEVKFETLPDTLEKLAHENIIKKYL